MILSRESVGAWVARFFISLCLISGIVAAACSGESRDREKTAARDSEAAGGAYRIISTEELQGWLNDIDPRWLSERESLLIVDTTPYVDSYRKHHIPYAAHFEIPREETSRLDEEARAAFEKVLGPDRHRRIVLYSESADCNRSHNGAKWAVSLGYTRVYLYRQGIKGWMEAGNQTETAR
jgi:rhodanese-related sulfurtransferase